jgi:predicted DNA-binding transcriptional regulator AlpA
VQQAQDTGKKVSLLTAKEAAALLRVSTSTMAKWRLRGEGPSYIKLGAKIAYSDDIVNAWLASRVRQSTSQTAAA